MERKREPKLIEWIDNDIDFSLSAVVQSIMLYFVEIQSQLESVMAVTVNSLIQH